jgi:hypothetical protein
MQTQGTRYLGMYVDGKLTWRTHIQKTVEKTRRKLNVLKSLAGTMWDNSRSGLSGWCKISIECHIQSIYKTCPTV